MRWGDEYVEKEIGDGEKIGKESWTEERSEKRRKQLREEVT